MSTTTTTTKRYVDNLLSEDRFDKDHMGSITRSFISKVTNLCSRLQKRGKLLNNNDDVDALAYRIHSSLHEVVSSHVITKPTSVTTTGSLAGSATSAALMPMVEYDDDSQFDNLNSHPPPPPSSVAHERGSAATPPSSLHGIEEEEEMVMVESRPSDDCAITRIDDESTVREACALTTTTDQLERNARFYRMIEEEELKDVRDGVLCFDNHESLMAKPPTEADQPTMEAIRRSYVYDNGFMCGYTREELSELGRRACANGATCVAVTLDQLARHGTFSSSDGKWTPAHSKPCANTIFVDERVREGSLHCVQFHPFDRGSDDEVECYMMSEFLTPSELQRVNEWIAAGRDGSVDPLVGLNGRCYLCEIEYVNMCFIREQRMYVTTTTTSSAHRADYFAPLNRFEVFTGPGEYNPDVMIRTSSVNKSDFYRRPNRPTVFGKFPKHSLLNYLFVYSTIGGGGGNSRPRPAVCESALMDFRPIISTVNASFCGLPKLGWQQYGDYVGRCVPRGKAAIVRTHTAYKRAFYSSNDSAGFELRERLNVLHGWFARLGRTTSSSALPPKLTDTDCYLPEGSSTNRVLAEWLALGAQSPVALHDAEWFERLLVEEGFAHLGTLDVSKFNTLHNKTHRDDVDVFENVASTPLAQLRRLFLLKGSLEIMLYVRQTKFSPEPSTARCDSGIGELHELPNMNVIVDHWRIRTMALPDSACRVIRSHHGDVDVARELVRYEAILAPFYCTWIYLRERALAARASGYDREKQAWRYEKSTDTWVIDKHTPSPLAEEVCIDKLFRKFQIPLPLSLYEATRKFEHTKCDLLDLVLEGFGFLATIIFRMYHLHSLPLAVARRVGDRALNHATQLLIDEHTPALAFAVNNNIWSDEAWFATAGAINVGRDGTAFARAPPTESSLHPDATLYAAGFRISDDPLRDVSVSAAHYLWPGLHEAAVTYEHLPYSLAYSTECGVIGTAVQSSSSTEVVTESHEGSTSASAKSSSTTTIVANVSTGNIADAYNAYLCLVGEKLPPQKSRKRTDEQIINTILINHPELLNVVAFKAHVAMLGNLPGILHRPTFGVRLRAWLAFKSVPARIRAMAPDASELALRNALRTWIMREFLLAPGLRFKELGTKQQPRASSGGRGRRKRAEEEGAAEVQLLDFGSPARYIIRFASQHLLCWDSALAARNKLSQELITSVRKLNSMALVNAINRLGSMPLMKASTGLDNPIRVQIEQSLRLTHALDCSIFCNWFYNNIVRLKSLAKHCVDINNNNNGKSSATPTTVSRAEVNVPPFATFLFETINKMFSNIVIKLAQTLKALNNTKGASLEYTQQGERIANQLDQLLAQTNKKQCEAPRADEVPSFEPHQVPATKVHCYEWKQIMRMSRASVLQLLHVPLFDVRGGGGNNGENGACHLAFKRIVFRIQRSRKHLATLPLRILSYFRCPATVINRLSRIQQMYKQNVSEKTLVLAIYSLWVAYPEHMALVWRYVWYLNQFSSRKSHLLPLHIRQMQNRALINSRLMMTLDELPTYADSINRQYTLNNEFAINRGDVDRGLMANRHQAECEPTQQQQEEKKNKKPRRGRVPKQADESREKTRTRKNKSKVASKEKENEKEINDKRKEAEESSQAAVPPAPQKNKKRGRKPKGESDGGSLPRRGRPKGSKTKTGSDQTADAPVATTTESADGIGNNNTNSVVPQQVENAQSVVPGVVEQNESEAQDALIDGLLSMLYRNDANESGTVVPQKKRAVPRARAKRTTSAKKTTTTTTTRRKRAPKKQNATLHFAEQQQFHDFVTSVVILDSNNLDPSYYIQEPYTIQQQQQFYEPVVALEREPDQPLTEENALEKFNQLLDTLAT